MNVHQVSTLPEYWKVLENQKRTLEDAQSLKGQRPRQTKTRDEIIMNFSFHRMMDFTRSHKFNIRSSFVPPAYPPCIVPLQELTKVMLSDLRLETHHRGSYVLLRAVTPNHKMTAVMTIVEDENEDVFTLQLYHQNDQVVEQMLHEGTILIVKEPYLKLMSDGNYGIRVDHLSDIVYLPTYDQRVTGYWRIDLPIQLTSAISWKEKGNEDFRKARYYLAIECYNQSLRCSPTADEIRALKLNLSLALLKTTQFDAALHHLDDILKAAVPAEKALFRKSQALYNLGRYEECCEVLKDLRMQYPTNGAAKEEFTRAINRLAEQKKGRYQFKELYGEANRLQPPHLDHATYIGPVAVRASGSKGRGLFTTKAVKAGDLLLCEKAFIHSYIDSKNSESSQEMTLLMNTETNTMTMGAQAHLIRLAVQKMSGNPSLASVITDLYHGSYKPVSVTEVDATPVVDTFLVERTITLNVFGCPLSSREYHISTMSGTDTQPGSKDDIFHSCGIWPMASYINHSCDSNARRAFIGDMMIVRASRDLARDTEITFWYKSPNDKDYEGCQKSFDHWGFKCDCSICQDVRTTGKTVVEKRKGLIRVLTRLLQSRRRSDTAKIESTLSTMADTYSQPATKVPRLSLWSAQLALAKAYLHQKQPLKAVQFALNALESLGYVVERGNPPRLGTRLIIQRWGLMQDSLAECWMLLATAYDQLSAPELAVQAMKYARTSYQICIGESETFEET